MSRMPNYKLKYDILFQIHKFGSVNVSDTARRFKSSKHTIYSNIEKINNELE